MNSKTIETLILTTVSTLVLTLAILFSMTPTTTSGADSGITAPDTIQFTSTKKPLKIFNHIGHIEAQNGECVICHHTGDTSLKCLDCHNAENPDVGEVTGSKKVFHGNCVPCHKQVAKDIGKKSKCKDCHKKKKRKKIEGC